MTNRDRDALLKHLRELADRLHGAPDRADARAQEHAKLVPANEAAFVLSTYRAAALESACRDEANALRRHIEFYLAPRPSKIRGKR